LAFFSIYQQAQIQKAELIDADVFQHRKVEWNVVVKSLWSNPYVYSKIVLDLMLISPSGKQLSLPGFYESGNSGG
jgi:hypothetical protein